MVINWSLIGHQLRRYCQYHNSIAGCQYFRVGGETRKTEILLTGVDNNCSRNIWCRWQIVKWSGSCIGPRLIDTNWQLYAAWVAVSPVFFKPHFFLIDDIEWVYFCRGFVGRLIAIIMAAITGNFHKSRWLGHLTSYTNWWMWEMVEGRVTTYKSFFSNHLHSHIAISADPN